MDDVQNAVDQPQDDLPRRSRTRETLGALVMAMVLVAVSVAVSRNWLAFVDSIGEVGVGGFALSLAAALIGLAGTYLQWRSVLICLGVRFGLVEGAQVFFVSQLGKYLPGSVWPVVMQMEAGRRRGASRKTMLAANLITVVLSVCVGVILAGLLLPFSVPSALHRFWWALAALPLLLVLAHPRSLPFLLDRVLKALHRAPLGVQMTGAATMSAVGWSVMTWVALGTHLSVLVAAIGQSSQPSQPSQSSLGLLILCVGGMGLAVSAGVLFLPAPAGAGMREIVLGFVLLAVLTSGQMLAAVIASRVIMLFGDLLIASLFALWSLRQPRTVAAL